MKLCEGMNEGTCEERRVGESEEGRGWDGKNTHF